jgi:hypothetical protein
MKKKKLLKAILAELQAISRKIGPETKIAYKARQDGPLSTNRILEALSEQEAEKKAHPAMSGALGSFAALADTYIPTPNGSAIETKVDPIGSNRQEQERLSYLEYLCTRKDYGTPEWKKLFDEAQKESLKDPKKYYQIPDPKD